MLLGWISNFRSASRRSILLSLVAIVFAGLPIARGAEATLDVKNPPGSLIARGPGNMKILFGTPPQTQAGSGTLVVALVPYDRDGVLLGDPIASYRQSIRFTPQGADQSVNIKIPRAGLFAVDAKLIASGGETVASKRINIAAIVPRNTPPFSDFGVVTHFAQGKGSPDIVLPLAKAAGFSWIRDEIYWDRIEQKPGAFAFPSSYDEYINATSKFGISPLVVLAYGNEKVYPEYFKAGQSFPQTAEGRQRFVRYVDEVVRRYGTKVKYWEIWNEPAFAQIGYPDYVALLKAVYGQIKQRNPDATVIACGGGGAGGGPGGDCFLATVKDGALEYQDAVSVHPYMSPHIPETGYPTAGGAVSSVSIPTVWPYLHQLLDQNPKAGGRRVQLWITELGWPSRPASDGLNDASQAANLVRSYLLSRRYGGVNAMFWYDFVDDGRDESNREDNFGMLKNDLSPKPAYVAAATLSATLGSRSWNSALVDDADVKIYQYGKSSPVIVGWTTQSVGRVVSVHVPAGDYVQRDWQGVESPVTVAASDFKWTLGPLPAYLLPKAVAR